MSSVKIYVIVEGTAEQTFVRDVLAPWMAHKGIYLYAVRIGTPGHKGGNVRFVRARSDIDKLLNRPHIFVTTMFDYFRIDPDWPGKDDVCRQLKTGGVLTACRKAEILEAATKAEIVSDFRGREVNRRFVPYISMHEFEALLFSDAAILAEKIGIEPFRIREILEQYDGNPEEINDDPVKAPSKRIEALIRGYCKAANGKMISEAIGIQHLRERCAHFNDWLTRLERLQGEL